MKKKRLLVICPGRGSYTKDTLGYLKKYGDDHKQFISHIDHLREQIQEPSMTQLDGADQFKVSVHTKGEHASPLIYSCAHIDFHSIDRDANEIVAICGNSMGWYLTLAFGGVLDWNAGFNVIQTMGSMMKSGLIGGQIIYPIVNEQWVYDPRLVQMAEQIVAKHDAHISIRLGGYLVIAGHGEALKAVMGELPKTGDYPFQLINHGAFHTPLLRGVSESAFRLLPPDLFQAPNVSLVDGHGRIWRPMATDIGQLHEYTFGSQVTDLYDFTLSLEVAIKEFAPDLLVLLGPGGSLGGSIGQILVNMGWEGIKSKLDFQERQKNNPFLISMGMSEQRRLVTKL